MRRLTSHDRDDQGVATIFLILAMVALLVGAGFAIDVGRYVLEARSAQNSADATVLAVATDCASTGSPIADYTPYRKPGQSINTPACGSGETTITVTKPVSDGLFLNQDAGEVDRSATARWGTLGTAKTLPITISNCEFDEALLDGTGDITLLLDNAQPQTGCSSLPGGFSQLASAGCEVTVSASGTAEGKPGNDLQDLVDCILPVPQDILIPVYDAGDCQEAECRGQGPYPILGFAMFRITGYWFTNNHTSGGTLRNQGCPPPESGPTPGNGAGTQSCIRGDFVRFVTSQGSPGPGTNFGTNLVYLSS